MKGVLITGATGFLGGALSRALLREGADVIALGRQPEALDALARAGAITLARDLATPGAHLPPPGLPAISHMVHAAALSSPWGRPEAFRLANVEGTRSALGLARALGVTRFVHISTPSVYFRFRDQENVTEDAPLPTPVNAYAATKREAETLVAAAMDLDPVILRPRGLYGVGDTALLPRLLAVARRRALPLMRRGQAATDLTHIDDVVSAVLAALRAPAGGDAGGAGPRVFNISGGVALPIREVVEAVCARHAISPRWRPLPFALVRALAHAGEALSRRLPGEPEPPVTAYGAGLFAFRQTLDLSRARHALGWQPRIAFAEGLARTFGEAPTP